MQKLRVRSSFVNPPEVVWNSAAVIPYNLPGHDGIDECELIVNHETASVRLPGYDIVKAVQIRRRQHSKQNLWKGDCDPTARRLLRCSTPATGRVTSVIAVGAVIYHGVLWKGLLLLSITTTTTKAVSRLGFSHRRLDRIRWWSLLVLEDAHHCC